MKEENKTEFSHPVDFTKVKLTFAAGFLTTGVLYSFDTTAKRLHCNQLPIKNLATLNQVIFGDVHAKPMFCRALSLFSGFRYAAVLRVPQFFCLDLGVPYTQKWAASVMGGRSIYSDAAGYGFMSVFEATLLMIPDSLKVRNQARNSKTTMHFANPYKALPVTIFGNAAFFATNGTLYPRIKAALVKHGIFGNPNQKEANEQQEVLAKSAAAALAGIPCNGTAVLKARMQMLPKNSSETARSLGVQLLKNEGVGALFNGAVPRFSLNALRFWCFFKLQSVLKNAFVSNDVPDVEQKNPSPGKTYCSTK